MNKKNILIIFIIVTGFTAFFIFSMIDMKKKYLIQLNEFNNLKISSIIERPFIIKSVEDMECPLTSNEVLFKENKSWESQLRFFFKDLLNVDSNELLYIPIYNRVTKRCNAFFIISSGVDGKMNTYLTEGDSIYIDDCFNRFNFYNKRKTFPSDTLWLIDSTTFSYKDACFGNKDLLISYFNLTPSPRILPND